MLHMDWFVRTMKRTFNVAVNIDEVGYEAYEFYHEELDNYLVPEEHLEKQKTCRHCGKQVGGLQVKCRTTK